jgi:hypothetical protein
LAERAENTQPNSLQIFSTDKIMGFDPQAIAQAEACGYGAANSRFL